MIEQLLDEGFDGGALAVESEMCLSIGGAPRLVEMLEARAVRGQRPPSVRGHTIDQRRKRHVEPDGQAVAIDERTVLGIGKRAATSGDDRVPQRQQVEQHLPFDVAEVRFALPREDAGDSAALARLDAFVDVFDAPVEARAERARERGLAGAHEADQIDLVSPHDPARRGSRRTRDTRRRPLRRPR